MPTSYSSTIHRLAPEVNTVGVECSMRLQYGTLDHLDEATFRQEIEIAKRCETTRPGYLRDLADSYGRRHAFDDEEQRKRRGC